MTFERVDDRQHVHGVADGTHHHDADTPEWGVDHAAQDKRTPDLRRVTQRSKLRAVEHPADRQIPVRDVAGPPRISAVIITLDSARLLESVLAALRWCDEIVIVDSGSSDETLAIAARHGCRVLHRTFDGFGTQKGWAVEQARNDWVFVVDDDEIASDALGFEILERVRRVEAGALPFRGFTVPISLVFLGRREVAGIGVGTVMTADGMVGVHQARLAILNPTYRLRD